MTDIFKHIVKFKLKWLAKIYLWRFKPYVILIAGTTGRHWIKEKVKEILEEKNLLVRANKKNFNSEIGLPLSILDLSSGEGSFRGWLKILWQGVKKILNPQSLILNSQYLILEIAIDRPENINYLTSIIRPNIVILTTVTMIYSENFENLDEISREYGELVKTLPWNGILILNNDDLRIKELKEYFDGRIITFGFSNDSQYRAININKISDGQIFKIEIQRKEKEILDVKINRFGQHHIYAELVGAVIRDNFSAIG
ncbi:MAG: Mur ligase family protein [Patescibacteria group bacterium]